MNRVVDEVYTELRLIANSLEMIGDLCAGDAYVEPKLMADCLAVHTRSMKRALEQLKEEFYSGDKAGAYLMGKKFEDTQEEE